MSTVYSYALRMRLRLRWHKYGKEYSRVSKNFNKARARAAKLGLDVADATVVGHSEHGDVEQFVVVHQDRVEFVEFDKPAKAGSGRVLQTLPMGSVFDTSMRDAGEDVVITIHGSDNTVEFSCRPMTGWGVNWAVEFEILNYAARKAPSPGKTDVEELIGILGDLMAEGIIPIEQHLRRTTEMVLGEIDKVRRAK